MRRAEFVTVATMVLAGGGIDTVYGIYRARLRTRRGQRYWDLNAPSTERVGTYGEPRSPGAPRVLLGRPLTPPGLRAALVELATPEAPAFSFELGYLAGNACMPANG